jgi:hypothetical protein
MGLVAWFRRISDRLRARRQRLEAGRWLRWQANDMGLRVSHRDQLVVFLPWDDIAEIVAFKRDLYAFDQICVGFRTTESDEYTCIEEENPDYERVVKLTQERFPLQQKWWSAVALPPFETKWTTIWGSAPSEDKSTKRSP